MASWGVPMNDGGTINLWSYASVLWSRRYVVAAVMLVALLIALMVNVLTPRVYEARALVLVTKPSFQVGAAPDPGTPGPKIGMVLVAEFPVEALAVFARSPSVVRHVTGPPSTRRPALTFASRPLHNSNLVELRVRGRPAERVADAANAWALIVAERSSLLFSSEAKRSYEFYARRLVEAEQRLKRAEETLRRFNATNSLGVLEARINTLTNQLASYRARTVDLEIAINKAQAQLGQLERQIAGRRQTLTLSKSVSKDPVAHEIAAQATGRSMGELSRLILKEEELNPTYMALDKTRADTIVQLAGLRSEQLQVVRALEQFTTELAALQARQAAQRMLVGQLTRSVENEKQVYNVLLERREESRVAAEGQGGSANVVAEAIAPEAPVAPQTGMNVAIALLLGLMAGVAAAFLAENVGLPQAMSPFVTEKWRKARRAEVEVKG